MKHRFLEWSAWDKGAWFRDLGYGLHVKLAKGHVVLFSERYGHRKALYLFGLRFELLRPVWRTYQPKGE